MARFDPHACIKSYMNLIYLGREVASLFMEPFHSSCIFIIRGAEQRGLYEEISSSHLLYTFYVFISFISFHSHSASTHQGTTKKRLHHQVMRSALSFELRAPSGLHERIYTHIYVHISRDLQDATLIKHEERESERESKVAKKKATAWLGFEDVVIYRETLFRLGIP